MGWNLSLQLSIRRSLSLKLGVGPSLSLHRGLRLQGGGMVLGRLLCHILPQFLLLLGDVTGDLSGGLLLQSVGDRLMGATYGLYEGFPSFLGAS